jgi:hypothetical protein
MYTTQITLGNGAYGYLSLEDCVFRMPKYVCLDITSLKIVAFYISLNYLNTLPLRGQKRGR